MGIHLYSHPTVKAVFHFKNRGAPLGFLGVIPHPAVIWDGHETAENAMPPIGIPVPCDGLPLQSITDIALVGVDHTQGAVCASEEEFSSPAV